MIRNGLLLLLKCASYWSGIDPPPPVILLSLAAICKCVPYLASAHSLILNFVNPV